MNAFANDTAELRGQRPVEFWLDALEYFGPIIVWPASVIFVAFAFHCPASALHWTLTVSLVAAPVAFGLRLMPFLNRPSAPKNAQARRAAAAEAAH
jgi:hypothetical protein